MKYFCIQFIIKVAIVATEPEPFQKSEIFLQNGIVYCFIQNLMIKSVNRLKYFIVNLYNRCLKIVHLNSQKLIYTSGSCFEKVFLIVLRGPEPQLFLCWSRSYIKMYEVYSFLFYMFWF
jgi:hypothetical protein